MGPVKLKFVVSFSSQDKIQKVSNLLTETPSTKRWLSDPQDRSGQIDAVFQLDRPCQVAYIDVGVIWCASVEVRVGKSDWAQGTSYVTLVPTQVLMSPLDSRLGRHSNRMCMFSKAHFTEEGASPSTAWDRIQLIGRQPWRKDVQMGLSSLRIRCIDILDPALDCSTTLSDTGGKPSGETLSIADMKHHFFGNNKDGRKEDAELKNRLQKIAAATEGVSVNSDILSRNARMVLMANKKSSNLEVPSQDDDVPSSVSSDVLTKQSVESEEVARFLKSLRIKKEDIESLKVSDLRHKFEKLKWRKLTVDEKRTFYNCCQDFIGQMFDENDADDVNSDSSARDHAEDETISNHRQKQKSTHIEENGSTVCKSDRVLTHKPDRTNTSHKCTPESGNTTTHLPENISNTSHARKPERNKSSHKPERVHTSHTNESERTKISGKSTPERSTTSHAVGHSRIVNGNRGPSTEHTPGKLSGGFLTSVFSRTEAHTSNNTVTPNKAANSASKRHDDGKMISSNVDQNKNGRSPTPAKSCSGNKISPYTKLNDTNRASTASTMKRKANVLKKGHHLNKMNAEKEKKTSPTSLSGDLGSNASALTSKIDVSLLHSHRQFVKGRLENRSSKKFKSSSIEDDILDNILDENLASDPVTPHSPVQSPLQKLTPKPGSRKSAKKCEGTPLTPSENSNSTKQRHKTCSSLASSNTVTDTGQWLNAKRGPDTSCRGGGGGGRSDGSHRGGSGGGRKKTDWRSKAMSLSSSEESDSERLPESVSADRSGGGTRALTPAKSRGGAKRRLTLPGESVTSLHEYSLTHPHSEESPASTFDTPSRASVSSDTDDPYAGELELAETEFVQCPLCDDMFPSDLITSHAADCQGQACGGGAARQDSFVQCPLCDDMFSSDVIAEHASHCRL